MGHQTLNLQAEYQQSPNTIPNGICTSDLIVSANQSFVDHTQVFAVLAQGVTRSPAAALRALSILVGHSLDVIFIGSVVLTIRGWWEGLSFMLNSIIEVWLCFVCASESLLICIRKKIGQRGTRLDPVR